MNKKINPLKELLLYCRRYAFPLAAALILGAACAVFSVIGPNKIADMVDLIEQGLRSGFDLKAIGRIGIFLAVLYGLGWVFGYIQQFILTTVTQRMTHTNPRLNLTFPKIHSQKLKKSRRHGKNGHKNFEKGQKNSAISAPIWYNVNSHKNIKRSVLHYDQLYHT